MNKWKLILVLACVFCNIARANVAPDDVSIAPDSEPMIMPTREMRAETIYMMRCMEELHYNRKDISLLDHSTILRDYMGELDINRMIFTQKEVDDFTKRFSATLDIFISGGSLMPAFTIFDQYRRDAYARLDWVEKRLQQDWDFSAEECYTPDRKDAKWPVNSLEADMLWEKRLKYELLNEIMDSEGKLSTELPTEEGKEKPPAPIEALAKAREIVAKRYKNLRTALKDFDSWLIEEIFLNSLSHMYDPHSSFLSKTSLDDFNVMLLNSLVGIGAVLIDDNGTCIIKELHPGGPASLSKQFKVGDKILAVAQGVDGEFVDIVGMRLYKSVRLMRGEKGTIVRLKIQPVDAGPGDYKIVQLMRDEIHLMETRASGKLFELDLNGKKINIGVIDLPAFYGNDPNSDRRDADTTSDMRYLINKFKEHNIVGLIVDLRRNSGGFLEQAVGTSGLFIKTGPIVQVRDSSGKIENLCDEDESIEWTGPLIALTSAHSASASEIFVGALRDHRRAVIVGDPTTHGKGSVQIILPMNKFFSSLHDNALGAARVTVQKWYLPTGHSTQLNGVPADIKIPSFDAYLPVRESDLPHALSCDSVPAANFAYEETAKKLNYFVDPKIIKTLKKHAKVRQNGLKEFQILSERITNFRENISQKEISLNLEKRRQKSLADLQFKRKIKAELEELIAQDDYKFEKIRLEGDGGDDNREVYDIKQNELLPDFDIQLRECLRIVRDWFEILHPECAKATKDGTSPQRPIAE
ncbi:MAG: carboxy terminal-processing peptidase [Puniceicoccales bacterium]|jgi:carboxyl-terminal processing protease|nr:carboxy terminal-processing peptidase [Puniceicoccales bacterium]